jgi:microcystin-dependent protein
MSDFYVGQIMQVGFNFAPANWQPCNGQTIAITQNQALFSLLGVTYGGNGSTNFLLPNLQSRVIIGAGTGPGLSTRVQGSVGGQEQVTLGISQLPSHNHTATAGPVNVTSSLQAVSGITNQTQVAFTPTQGAKLSNTFDQAAGGGSPQIYAPTSTTGGTGVNLGGLTVTASSPSVSIGQTGSSQPVPTLPPFLAILNVIAMFGIFPSRN